MLACSRVYRSIRFEWVIRVRTILRAVSLIGVAGVIRLRIEVSNIVGGNKVTNRCIKYCWGNKGCGEWSSIRVRRVSNSRVE